jgi:2,3-bisphosphoglycerate-independent phosphoglycerate mutase
VQTTDRCLGAIAERVRELGGVTLVTADHGNAEQLLEADGVSPHTAHSTNPVPLVAVGLRTPLRDGGELADLAPTCLELLGLEQPAAMTGRSLLAPGG